MNFAPVTFIYAENGRGKSTIATLLRACASGDATRLGAKRTLDAPGDIEVSLLFSDGQRKTPVNLHNGKWSNKMNNIVVFDSEFVEQNVYSGFQVRPDQRQSLLEFALGSEAVRLKQSIDSLTKQIELQTRSKTDADKKLGILSGKMKTEQFIGMPAIPDAKQQIATLNRRIDAAKNSKALLTRQDPVKLQPIELDITSITDILGKTLEDVHEAADKVVREHFAKHPTPHGIEDWVGKGLSFDMNDACPFCGQTLTGVSLIDAYRDYFNQEYNDLKQRIITLNDSVESALSDNRLQEIVQLINLNSARMDAWKDQISVQSPSLDSDSLGGPLKRARERAIQVIDLKRHQPLESVQGGEFRVEFTETLTVINDAISCYNSELDGYIEKITEFRQQLTTEQVSHLESQVSALRLAMARHEVATIEMVNEYMAATEERGRLDTEKVKARAELDKLMESTLGKYEDRINAKLRQFGASFSIKRMRPNYQGSGEPRVEYVLQVRQRDLPLGTKSESDPYFGSVLSEGDKHTLAFAFFFARLEAEPTDMADKIIVIDDPVSSLDINRRMQTVNAITNLTSQCRQVVILSHDPHFIRQVRDSIARVDPGSGEPQIIGIIRTANEYSVFSTCDIDWICASPYYRHHQIVSDYVIGTYQSDIRDVAKALRPLIEGFYHRRFPGMMPQRAMFGKIIALIEQAEEDSPLKYLQNSVTQLSELNEYASRFHHDSNSECESALVTDGELKYYAKLALELIYRGSSEQG